MLYSTKLVKVVTYMDSLFVEMDQNSLNLFFADDCLLFCRSTLEECEKIQQILAYYEEASGQVVNKDKTTLLFSKNTSE